MSKPVVSVALLASYSSYHSCLFDMIYRQATCEFCAQGFSASLNIDATLDEMSCWIRGINTHSLSQNKSYLAVPNEYSVF